MNLLETTIAAVIATIVSGTISVLITHRKQRQFFEYQTKFSSLHQEQAHVVKGLYGLLGEANECITQLVSPTFNPADTGRNDNSEVQQTRRMFCQESHIFRGRHMQQN